MCWVRFDDDHCTHKYEHDHTRKILGFLARKLFDRPTSFGQHNLQKQLGPCTPSEH